MKKNKHRNFKTNYKIIFALPKYYNALTCFYNTNKFFIMKEWKATLSNKCKKCKFFDSFCKLEMMKIINELSTEEM